MPDQNKFNALHEAGFRVVPTCITCAFFTKGPRAGWGHCSSIPHDHGKHGQRSTTGVPTNGWCQSYDHSEVELDNRVGTYVTFFQPDSHAE